MSRIGRIVRSPLSNCVNKFLNNQPPLQYIISDISGFHYHGLIVTKRCHSSWEKTINRYMGFIVGSTLKNAKSLLNNCKDQAFNQLWFTKGDIEPNFRSKQTLLMLHIWIVHKRLIKEDKPGKLIQECLFDQLWDDTSNRIRGEGIEELSVNKNLKDVQGYSFRVSIELDQAINGKTEAQVIDDIGGVLWRSLYNRNEGADEAKIIELARYVRMEQLTVDQLPKNSVFEGRILWSKIPWANDRTSYQRNYRSKGQRNEKDERTKIESNSTDSAVSLTSSTSESSESSEWREATALDGRTYYWHPVTRESRWTKP